tara:strand:- start:236 stop:415 length:180 start_codon:yes stop_codon:yes gene_type:complete
MKRTIVMSVLDEQSVPIQPDADVYELDENMSFEMRFYCDICDEEIEYDNCYQHKHGELK